MQRQRATCRPESERFSATRGMFALMHQRLDRSRAGGATAHRQQSKNPKAGRQHGASWRNTAPRVVGQTRRVCARCREDPAIDRSRRPSGDTRSRRCVPRPWPRHSSNCASLASATVRALISNSPTRRRHRSPLSANGASRQAAIPLVAHHTDRRRVPPHLFRPKQPAGEPRTAAEPNWVCEYLPFVPNEMALRMLLNAENPKEGSLLARAPPATPGRGCS